MASERKPRPPVPPKVTAKQRSLSVQSESEQNNSSHLVRCTRPPDDVISVLNLPAIEPQTFLDDEGPVFYNTLSLPNKSSQRELPLASETRNSNHQDFKQAGNEIRRRSFSNHVDDTESRRFSDTLSISSSMRVVEEFMSFSPTSLQSICIEPSPERLLSLPGADKGSSSSDPNLVEATKPRGILRSDPEDIDSSKVVKGRGLRSSLLLSKSTNALASLNSPEGKAAKNISPDKKKVDVESLNRFFGESKETATDLEASVYHMLIAGNQSKAPSAVVDTSRAKKSASTWFLSPKGLESLPERPLDAQVPKAKKTIADELSAHKLKDELTDRGKKIMKSFKRRIGVSAYSEGVAPVEVLHKTFEIPLEDCVMSYTNRFIPLVVEKCISVIDEEGLYLEGIYRLSGNGISMNELQEELDKEPLEINHDNERWNEVHVVSNLLKLFFRKLPDSLITDELYESVIAIARLSHSDKRLLKLKLLLERLPKIHFETFKLLSHHLHRVASNWNVNKMDAHNLAIMFGPTLIRSPKDQTLTMIKDMNDQTTIVETIIKHCEWLFGGWSADRSIPSDETSVDTSASSASNLQLLASAETLVARKLKVLPAEESSSSFFHFQGPLRRSRRKHRQKAPKDGNEVTEQMAAQDATREIELRRVKIPELPFKTISTPLSDGESSHRTLSDGKSRIRRNTIERLDIKTLDIKLVSNKFGDTKDLTGAEMTVPDVQKAAAASGAKYSSPENQAANPVIEIKTYRAYDPDVLATTLTQNATTNQPTLLRKYSSKSQLVTYGDSGSLRKGSLPNLTKPGSYTLDVNKIENRRPEINSVPKQTNVTGHRPDISQLDLDRTGQSAYWENGSLDKKTNIVVRGPFGRRYCVLSDTDPDVFINRPLTEKTPSNKKRQIAKRLDKQQCAMKYVINVRLDVIQNGGSNDIELRKLQYL